MSRAPHERLEDILVACRAIGDYVEREGAVDDLVFDAIRMRLVEIGEAVKDLDDDITRREPGVPWRDIAGMRDLLAHRYFDTTHAIVVTTARVEIPQLAAAAERLRNALGRDEESAHAEHPDGAIARRGRSVDTRRSTPPQS